MVTGVISQFATNVLDQVKQSKDVKVGASANQEQRGIWHPIFHHRYTERYNGRKGRWIPRDVLALCIMEHIKVMGWSENEKNHFLSQIEHETENLTYTEELASGSAYEGRKDLGNLYPGDGKKYKGHGVIQTTGRYNHQKFADRHGVPEIMDDPMMLSQIAHYAVLSAIDWWEDKKASSARFRKAVETDDVLNVSIGVNGRNKKTGMPNHYKERLAQYQECKSGRGDIRRLAKIAYDKYY